ncbi:MAG: response regulator [Candidatus Cloacimonetes bacterium]|nr:response regulator [Candidatus Cloacimonadota bacterium]
MNDKNVNILLVEDNKMDIALTLDAFKVIRLSNLVRVVRNGEETIDYLTGAGKYTDRDEYPLPGLILLDLKLPKVSGIEVLKFIKTTPVIKRIPTIILTSSNDESNRIKTYDLGINSYLVKPVTFEGFIKIVNKISDYWITLNMNAPLRGKK